MADPVRIPIERVDAEGNVTGRGTALAQGVTLDDYRTTSDTPLRLRPGESFVVPVVVGVKEERYEVTHETKKHQEEEGGPEKDKSLPNAEDIPVADGPFELPPVEWEGEWDDEDEEAVEEEQSVDGEGP